MKVYYYLNGKWELYQSAKNIQGERGGASFEYVNNAGQAIKASGQRVEHSELGYNAPVLPGASYYKRVGSQGPVIFAITQDDVKAAVQAGISPWVIGLLLFGAWRLVK